MKIAIISRGGPCFPNIISLGLQQMLDQLKIESKIYTEGIPFIMRLLPLNKRPVRWHNNLQFRIRNKAKNYRADRRLLKELNEYDAVIISECYPNAFWKNYYAIEEPKRKIRGKVISYTEGPLDSAPANKLRLLNKDDHNETIYDFNLFVSDIIEVKKEIDVTHQSTIGINISYTGLKPNVKKEFIALIDFAQPGYEKYREQQIKILNQLRIKTIVLEGQYPISDIRQLYQKASIFFLSFPETFGLPIAECFASGTYVFTPKAEWPMAWRINENSEENGKNILPDCFKIYNNDEDLLNQVIYIRDNYDFEKTPVKVYESFIKNYKNFYCGDINALESLIEKI